MLSIPFAKLNRISRASLWPVIAILALLMMVVIFDAQGRDAEARLRSHSQLQMQIDRMLADGWQLECALVPLPGAASLPGPPQYQAALTRLNRDALVFNTLLKQAGEESRAAASENLLLDLGVDPAFPSIDAARLQLAQLQSGLSSFAANLKESYGRRQQIAAAAHQRTRWGTVLALMFTMMSLVASAIWYGRRQRAPVGRAVEQTPVGNVSAPVDWHQRYAAQQSLYKEALHRARIITWRSLGQAGFTEFEFGSEDQREFYGLKARMTFEEFRALIHPDDAAAVIVAAEEMIANENPYYDACYRFRAANGEWRLMHSVGSPVARASDGSSMVASGLLQDVTDLQKLSAAVARQRPVYNACVSESATL